MCLIVKSPNEMICRQPGCAPCIGQVRVTNSYAALQVIADVDNQFLEQMFKSVVLLGSLTKLLSIKLPNVFFDIINDNCT